MVTEALDAQEVLDSLDPLDSRALVSLEILAQPETLDSLDAQVHRALVSLEILAVLDAQVHRDLVSLVIPDQPDSPDQPDPPDSPARRDQVQWVPPDAQETLGSQDALETLARRVIKVHH